jgi:hypothetical protein
VVGDYSLDTATHAAVAHGLMQEHLYHCRGDTKTGMRTGKHPVLVQATHIRDAARNNLLFLVLPCNGTGITFPMLVCWYHQQSFYL